MEAIGTQVERVAIDETRVVHVCESCGTLLAVHNHRSYAEVKACVRGMRPLCPECASWPGSECTLPAEGRRVQEAE